MERLPSAGSQEDAGPWGTDQVPLFLLPPSQALSSLTSPEHFTCLPRLLMSLRFLVFNKL